MSETEPGFKPTCSHKNMPLIVQRNIIAYNQKVESPMFLQWGVIAAWHSPEVFYYSTTKRNEVQVNATTCMDLENTVLNTRRQTQRNTYCMILFLWSVQNRQIHKDRNLSSGFQRSRRGRNRNRWIYSKIRQGDCLSQLFRCCD